MSLRKASNESKVASNAMWKVRPPGPEQKELERMFRSNEIEPGDSADSVRRSNEMFLKFNSSVFGNHFRTTKAKIAKEGRFANVSSAADPPIDLTAIPELGGTGALTGGKPDLSSDFRVERQPRIHFSNAPYWVWNYFNHVENIEFVCVSVVAICGIRNIDLEIAEDGYSLTIRYVWPAAIFKPAELFQKAKNADGTALSITHPKVHAFVANALDNGVNRFSSPKGEITIDLPQKVQRIPSTYRIEAMSVGDTNIILIELSAYHKAAVIEETNNEIVFK